MKRTLSILAVLIFVSLFSGCLLSKTPNANDVTMNLGEVKTFSVNIFPSNSTYTWTLDTQPPSTGGKSYLYTAIPGDHTLTVKAKHICGTDTVTWNIHTNVFNKLYGGTGDDRTGEVRQTSDGGYIINGWTTSFGAGARDGWLFKTDSKGNVIWEKAYGWSGDEVFTDILTTEDGGYIMSGQTKSVGSGGGDAWIIKTDADGNIQWDKTYGESGNDWADSIMPTDDNGYIVAARFNYSWIWIFKLDQYGNTIWSKIFYEYPTHSWPSRAMQTADGGYIVAGSTGISNVDGNALLLKLDSDGNKVWDKTFGTYDNDEVCNELIQSKDGGYVMVGSIYYPDGNDAAWLIKTDSYGNKSWEKTYIGHEAYSIDQTNDSGYIISGFADSGGSGLGAWILKTDSNGNMLWEKLYTGNANAVFATQTIDGGYILTGHIHITDTDLNAFLIKTDPNGNAPDFP
jgi:hypothetical protein